ncbi:plasmid pRiA4b ORF-3 family protein [Arthrobacter sp. HMWF013]|uniref:plasmid pRiA4b ORF-3 family protein n=1 Tax=Arthrobacter sp. HMWF013 TaxID=2056849 RepID=UPI001C624A09|nr:plasmid pRiA4b ORF-3 family protein [Arthrobacter sp. HMWF013]
MERRPGGKHNPGSVSLSSFRASRALGVLAPAFVHWFDDGTPGASAAALHYLKLVEPVVGRYLDKAAAPDVTDLDPVALALALSEEIAATASVQPSGLPDVEHAAYTVDAIHTYVGFLSDTGRWTGTAEQLADVLDFFDSLADGGDEPSLTKIPEVPQEAALEVLSGLPLIQRASALLRWIGEGKPVTGTGALRLRDIEAAAACVGVSVRGGSKGAVASDGVPTVRSMFDVPLLAQMWAALEAAELIAIKATKVVPFESEAFLGGDAPDQVDEFSMFASCFLEQAVLRHDPDQPWEKLVSALQTSLMLAAATPEPPLLERVLATPDHAPDAEKTMITMLTRLAMARMEALAELGLVTIDTHYRVPTALVGCVADAFDHPWVLADLGLGEESEGQETRTQPPESTGIGTPEKGPGLAEGPILQLKIGLKGSKPPIWRRVLVPAGISLPLLHQVIQGVFAWQDYHLHHFQTGGFRGPTYTPVASDGEDDFYGENSRDESKVTVAQLLPVVGSTMTYTYDFGDDWEHAITLEKVLKSDDGGRLPRCTGGRGAAPAEDSGGVGGWMGIVQAVNDPSHREHQEYREWMGLGPGETLDPTAFDLEQVNEDLAKALLTADHHHGELSRSWRED